MLFNLSMRVMNVCRRQKRRNSSETKMESLEVVERYL